jgi:hypothetical protein
LRSGIENQIAAGLISGDQDVHLKAGLRQFDWSEIGANPFSMDMEILLSRES